MVRRNRRLPVFLVLIALLLITLGFFQFFWNVQAQDSGQARYKTVEVQTTQYVWNLVNKYNMALICEVTIDRPGVPTNQEAFSICRDKILPATATPPSGPTLQITGTPQPAVPFNLNAYFQNTVWVFQTRREFTRVVKVPLPAIVLNISVPQGPLVKPYVTLLAYEPVTEYAITSIQGKINQVDFTCDGASCDIPIDQTTQISFRGYSSFGDRSQETQATIQLISRADGLYPSLTSLTPFTLFKDACAEGWGVSVVPNPKWAEFPQLPDGLRTKKPLFFLSSRLISTGIVKADDCPSKGLFSSSSPNSCGMDRAGEASTQWQNQYDPLIWTSGRSIGIPPKLIKTMIEKESQFWPGNSRFFVQEFGLAQINEIGADVALRWDNDLFKQTCNGILADCNTPYASLPTWQQDMIRGSLMNLIDSECPGCVNGLNQTTARQSIDIIGHVLKANCRQTGFILKDNSVSASYEDLWKFTLVSYHSGYQCLYNAIDSTFRSGQMVNWTNVSAALKCPGSKEYVDDFWNNLVTFDNYVQVAATSNRPIKLPTIVPTRTPSPTPLPVLSKNTIRTFVYVEIAGKQFPNDIQWAEGVQVQVALPDGSTVQKTVVGGQATFDMSAYPVGTQVVVSLPGFYRTFSVTLTEQGEILVPFRLKQPELPGVLP